MGQPENKKDKLTIQEWIELEQSGDIRYEYHFGEVLAMAGGTLSHTRIGKNASYELERHFREGGRKCEAFQSELKIEIQKDGRYVYPDTVAVCGDIDESDSVKGSITNPILVIEVVSESSGSYDRGRKYKFYRRLPSVKEYMILEQDIASATLYRRNGDGDLFTRHEFEGLETVIELKSVDLKIELGKFYRSVEFPPSTEEAPVG